MRIVITLTFILMQMSGSFAQNNPDVILGKWITEKGDCKVNVYKQGNEYRAKVIWFNVKTKPMEYWFDIKNPDPTLRTRKLLGLDVVNKLHYDPSANEWVDGSIYDPTCGKTWDSVVWLSRDNILKVKGYWVFRFLSKTLTFKRSN